MSTLPPIINTPCSVKFSSAFGGVGTIFVDASGLYNSSFLNTSRLQQYSVSLPSVSMSNIIYNICEALGNNKIVITGAGAGTYTIPDGYYTIGPFSNPTPPIAGPLSGDISTSVTALTGSIVTLTLNCPSPATPTDPNPSPPGSNATTNVSTTNPTLSVAVSAGSTIVSAPNVFGIQDYINVGLTGPVTIVTTSFGFRNTMNVCLNTQVEMNLINVNLSSSIPANPIAPAYALFSAGHMIISQNGFGSDSPVNHTTYGNSPNGDYYSPGIVLGNSPIPYSYQTTASPTYEGAVFTIQGSGQYPFCKPPSTVNYVTISFCDDYGYVYYIKGQIEGTIQFTSI